MHFLYFYSGLWGFIVVSPLLPLLSDMIRFLCVLLFLCLHFFFVSFHRPLIFHLSGRPSLTTCYIHPYTCHNTSHSLRLFFLRVSEHAVAFKQFSFDCFPINPAKVSHLPHHEPTSSILHAVHTSYHRFRIFVCTNPQSFSLSTHTRVPLYESSFFIT